MPTTEPYIEKKPRDLITAEDWNQMQVLIREDIIDQLTKALAQLQQVPKSGDSSKLEGKTLEELEQEIINAATQALNKRTGYMRVFKRLTTTETLIKHELKDYPVTDVYQLMWFDVICSEDDIKEKEKTIFYLYHGSEKRIRTKVNDGSTQEVEIEQATPAPFKIPFSKMLELYKVSYDQDTTLDELEERFWEALFSAPNDQFDDDHTCHSPWFDRCCGERRTVADLKRRGDWDQLFFQTRPVKTVNAAPADANSPTHDRPSEVVVTQYDFDTEGVRLLSTSTVQQVPALGNPADQPAPIPEHLRNEMPVLILLKV